MPEVEQKFLNPITVEAQMFLRAMEKYGSQYRQIDEELLNVMDKLVDTINKFYDQTLIKVEETDNLKLAKVEDMDCIVRQYTCTKCHKFLGPSAEKVAHHIICHKDEIKQNRRKNIPVGKALNSELKMPKKARSLFCQKISKFFKNHLEVSECLKQIPEYYCIEAQLISIIQPLFPDKDIELYKFGSRISGIGNKNSDLDIFVDIGKTYNTFENRASPQTLQAIKMVSKALKNDEKWKHVLAIENARVPIIRVEHAPTHISCDIGFSNSLGHCNTMLMNYFFQLQPIASRLCIFMKTWLERTKLNEHISTYSMTLMVIFYLQIKEILPSVQELQSNLENALFVGPWISNFEHRSLDDLNLTHAEYTKATFRELLLDFFAFYSEFDFNFWVVCPYFGSMYNIENIYDHLPESYQDFIKDNKGHFELQIKKPLIVQDPIELNHNVTKNISASLLKVFVDYVKDSAKRMMDSQQSSSSEDESIDLN